MLGHILKGRRQTMNRSDRHTTLSKDTVLNGARVLVSRPKRAWDAEGRSPKRAFQYAAAWMRVAQAVP